MAGERILVVDDEEDIRDVLGDRLEDMGYDVSRADDGEAGLAAIKSKGPDLVLLDVKMPKLTGFEVLQALQSDSAAPIVVIMTAHGSLENVVRAMRLGAYDFIAKPFDPERVEVVVQKALSQASLRLEHEALQESVREHTPEMIAEAPLMKDVISMSQRAAESDATVLILGESGTGKEVLAGAIHGWSERRNGPFVAVNCAALPDQLLESTLFGHEKGAFTGASQLKKGKFELARGGTILLDEIGELKPELQIKLLRVLQERTFERLGGNAEIKADVRLIAATNRNLQEAMQEGGFREDLFYRLNVVSFTLPPLRDRKEDIPRLAEHFLKQYSMAAKRRFDGIAEDAMTTLMAHPWPGNVRELANAIERAVVLGSGPLVESRDLPMSGSGSTPAGVRTQSLDQPYHEAVESFKKDLIQDTLTLTRGNQSQAAEKLGLQRTYLARLITNLGLRKSD